MAESARPKGVPSPISTPRNARRGLLYTCPVKSKGIGTAFVGLVAGAMLLLGTGKLAHAQTEAAQSATSGQPAATSPPPPSTQPLSVPAARKAENVAIITIRGPIDAVTAQSIERRIKLAEAQAVDAIVFDINTPGGEVGAVLEICNSIKGSSIVNTVAWINPDAYSGGVIVALACREIIANDPASMGDAIPIGISFGTLRQLNDEEREKILSVLIAELIDSARRRGYDEKLVQGLVALDVELWLIENTQTGEQLFIDRREYEMLFGPPPEGEFTRIPSSGVAHNPVETPAEDLDAPPAPSESEQALRFIPAADSLTGITEAVTQAQELSSTRPVLTHEDRGVWRPLEKATDGMTPIIFKTSDMQRYGLSVATIHDDTELKAFFGASNMRRFNRTWSESFVRLLNKTAVKGVLIVLLLLGAFLEMSSPGLSVPGAVALAALAGLIAPAILVDMAGWWELAAILGGVALILLELFVIPGFGVPGILGIIALFSGLVGTFIPDNPTFPGIPGQDQDMLYGVVTVFLALATASVGMYFISRHFGSLPIFNRLVLSDRPDDSKNESLLEAMVPAHDDDQIVRGMVGRSITPLRPAGRAEFEQTIVDVVSELEFIDDGQPVRVVSVGENRIVVERTDRGTTPGDDQA